MLKINALKVVGDWFRLSVCIYEESIHEIFTNRLRNVSASIIARAKPCLVKIILFCNALFFLHEVLTIARELKLAKLP